MSLALKDKIALITGASRGIGAAAAKKLAKNGAHVILVARSVKGLEEVDDEIKKLGGTSTLAPLDLLELDKIDQLISTLVQRFGKLDILVGNAGILGSLSPVSDIDNKTWDKVIDTNLTANFRLLRACHPLLKKSEAGRAIFVTSKLASKSTAPFWSLMSVSKAGLERMVKTYALENKNTNIKANLIDPGMINTSLMEQAFPGKDLSSHSHPEDISDIFVTLASPDYKNTGEIVKAGDL